ncbi:hypothetical protein V7014_22970, partial [Bacillus sp. JJ722]
TKKSIEHAGSHIKPLVEDLIAQIVLYPSSSKPYMDFADSIQLREAKEFVMVLNQIMKVDADAAKRLIEDQITIMKELQEETYMELLETHPDKVERYIMPMIFPLIAIILTFIFIMIADAFSTMM